MIFFSAISADVEELSTFVNSAYRGESAEAGWASESSILGGQRTDPAWLAEMLASGHTILLMRDREDSPLAGCVCLNPTDDPSTWYLSMLAIDPLRQAEGLGRALLQKGEDYIQAHRGSRSRISVIWVRDTLIDWYERRGYVRTGQTEPFPYEDRRFGLPRRDDLCFVLLEKPLPNPKSQESERNS